MVENGKLKITVLKRTDSKQIFGDNPPMGQAMDACGRFKEGQEFIVNENLKMPDGFCQWAWNDINKKVITLMFGGNFPWMKEEGTSVSCCTDGFRPVIFELRRIE
ncbi:TIGR04076 family protein [Candidatus Bathyarchaeota archaeon]|nr:TIGR04076 family protein [Candidatus Bathyarchaeota archaeon]